MTFWPFISWIDFPTDQNFHLYCDLATGLDLHRITSGFHGDFATGVVFQQGTLTLPDTWFSPLLGTCLCSNYWDQCSRHCRVFSRRFTLNTHRYFLDFALFKVSLFLCRLRSIAAHRDHFVRRLSVRPSVCLSVCLSVCPVVTLSW